LKYFVFLEYIAKRDSRNLLDLLKEDGAFGCWHYTYPDRPIVSRDLLDSINEILYLDRQLSIFDRQELKILDVGAGYGRLAHRMVSALPNITDYCCVDAIPESTFLCDFYIEHRGITPRARALPLWDVQDELKAGQFDIAVNIHSFSECTLEAVTWWINEISRLEIPYVWRVPNAPDELLTNEGAGLKLDFLPALESAGYRLKHKEPGLTDLAVQKLVDVYDQFHLFERHRA
jgi:SAM-dependent methyltransferase